MKATYVLDCLQVTGGKRQYSGTESYFIFVIHMYVYGLLLVILFQIEQSKINIPGDDKNMLIA